MPDLKLLFAASEAYPLIKTGGLGDVAGSLPRALRNLGVDVRLVLPAYREVMDKSHPRRQLLTLTQDGHTVSLWQTRLPGTRVKTWLIDCPGYFNKPGNPYHDKHGQPWQNNAQRYALFCRVIERLGLNQPGLKWQPDVVHCHDWQTGLVPALLARHARRPATVFTIHNLAYQGLFPFDTFQQLHLPAEFWHHERLEFHDQFSFIKGGVVYADRINTVSPNYAREIQSTEFGCGLDGLLAHRRDRLSGILNGIEVRDWNPNTDPYIAKTYNRHHLNDKYLNKVALQQHFNLPVDKETPLFGLASRLVQQKGIDLLLAALSELMSLPLQLVILGSGDKKLEKKLRHAAQRHGDKIGLHLGYNEALAHLIEAGADVFLMPSRFEPCGLNQMYSQRYGALPIVSPLGGLVDTVIDATDEKLKTGQATGFVMASISEAGLVTAIRRAMRCLADHKQWRSIQQSAMRQDFSWKKSAEAYLRLYQQALADNSNR